MTDQEIAEGLGQIADQIRSWLEWQKKDRDREHLVTDNGTHIMALPVPIWPSRGALEKWIEALEAGKAALSGLPLYSVPMENSPADFPEPSTITSKTVADFTKVCEQTGILGKKD